MDFYEKNGIIPYINAHDTYTVYGGSRMAENTLQAMKEATASFVDLKQMQICLLYTSTGISAAGAWKTTVACTLYGMF